MTIYRCEGYIGGLFWHITRRNESHGVATLQVILADLLNTVLKR